MNRNFDKYKVLDTVNQWIFNCDTKVSILLSTYGVLFSVILSSDIGSGMSNIIKTCVANKNTCSIAYLCFLVLAITIFGWGIYKLMRVLIPTINLNYNSIMFFGNIASYPSFGDYWDAVRGCNDDKIDKDLSHQIFAASKICNQKFSNQKQGIKASLLGLTLILFWLIIGYIVYYI